MARRSDNPLVKAGGCTDESGWRMGDRYAPFCALSGDRHMAPGASGLWLISKQMSAARDIARDEQTLRDPLRSTWSSPTRNLLRPSRWI